MGVLDNIFWNIMKIVKIYIALFFYPSVSKVKLSMENKYDYVPREQEKCYQI